MNVKEKRLFVNDNKLGTSVWWLRSVGSGGRDALDENLDGVVYADGDGVDDEWVGVRPALWLNLKS